MKNFIHEIKTKVIFGTEMVGTVGREVAEAGGTRVLLMYGKNSIKTSGLYDLVVNSLKESNIEYVELSGIKPNPSIKSVREGKRLIEENAIDFILAVGGGSVVDCAKAVSAATKYNGDPWDFFARTAAPTGGMPIGTIITLAATGSEMNTGAVISNEDTEEKLAFMHPDLRPVFTFEDPTLMYTLPAYQTAAGASDIMSHLLEQYFTSHEDEGLADRLNEAMMINVMAYAKKAIDAPSDYEARANLMWTSTLALNGMLSESKVGGDWTCHALEHEVSAIYDVTHGAGLAILYPNLLTVYLEKDILERKSLTKFTNIAKNVFKIENSTDEEMARFFIQELREWFNTIKMPNNLHEEGVDRERLEEMANKCVAHGISQQYQTLTAKDLLQALELSSQ